MIILHFKQAFLFPVVILLFFLLACSPKESTPPYLALFTTPSSTHHTIFGLRGRKNPGNQVVINNRVFVPADDASFWSSNVTLTGGNNTFVIKSINETGNESNPIEFHIFLDTTSPSLPGVTSPVTTVSNWSTSVSLQGTKDTGSDILLDGREIVSYTSSSLWSYTYSPKGTTTLHISSKNKVGNESAWTPITLNYQGALPPRLVSPLDGTRIKKSAGTPNLLFSWTDSSSQTFEMEIATTPDFSTTILRTNTLANPYLFDFSNPNTTLPLVPGAYFWRVGAYDPAGNLFFSSTRKLIYGKVKGDLNGDGYADLLVGAEKALGSGQVRVFLGGPDPSGGIFVPHANPNFTLQGESGDDLFGTALATGDLNGDGYDDVIIGAYHNSAGGNRAGRVYIYFGGPNPHTTPDLILTGLSPGEQFGVSVASGEDINGDGFDDLLVGANLNSGNGAYAGKAYLFFGGATISTNPDVVFNGESPGDHFGISVAMAGDINGDGFSDFLIGAGGDGTSSHAGKAYLYYGEFEPGNQPQMVFSGTPGDGYGRMVTGIRDINGDGYDDFLIGAPFHPGPNGPDLEPDAGEAYLFLGGVNLNSTPDLTLRLPPSLAVSQANFGFSATTVGDFPAPDINNFLRKDGYADFAVGAYGQITQSHTDGNGKLIVDAAAGKVHLFRGDLDLNTVSNIYASFASGNNSSNEFFSDSLSSPGDMNGDGFDDLIVGAMTADQTKGRAYYYNGYTLSNSLLCSTCALFGIYTLEGFGFAVK